MSRYRQKALLMFQPSLGDATTLKRPVEDGKVKDSTLGEAVCVPLCEAAPLAARSELPVCEERTRNIFIHSCERRLDEVHHLLGRMFKIT